MTETKMEVIKLMPKEYTQAEANAFKHGLFLGAKSEKEELLQKAFEFFGEHLWEYIDVKNANCGTYINIDGDKLKEDFRKYMGE